MRPRGYAECSYEGQRRGAARGRGDETERGEYEKEFYTVGGVTVFDWRPMVRQIASGGEAPEKVAAKFMNTLVSAAELQCRAASEATGAEARGALGRSVSEYVSHDEAAGAAEGGGL